MSVLMSASNEYHNVCFCRGIRKIQCEYPSYLELGRGVIYPKYGCGTLVGWVGLFVLRFYGPVSPMGSCRMRSVYLTTRLLGRLSPLSG